MPKDKVNSPVFVYNDSHKSLKHQYLKPGWWILTEFASICLGHDKKLIRLNNHDQIFKVT